MLRKETYLCKFSGSDVANAATILIGSLVSIARDAFVKKIEEEDVANHVFREDFMHLLYAKTKIVGFASYRNVPYLNTNILYLSGIVIRSAYQRHGLFRESMTTAIDDEEPEIIAMRTQSPVMYHAVKRLDAEIYPSLKVINEKAVSIGKALALRLKMENYDPQNFVGRGTYGTSLYGHVPTQVGDPETTKLFSKLRVDQQRGDSIIIVGFPRREEALFV